ncbi:extracellular solute-binding protein [Paenibacillus sp. LMG 31456]|uniref:Extracellular solute-binding protein n=1 Tax=Paenibacillus foliorum TaxID=2654974 RepID=A0A972GUN7_9BACL|nr:extracellular solute-binding protein [Paenibacillus foliorum]NOU96643.1 extracellular solute-binding protein [Paenibacillus foliorum]
MKKGSNKHALVAMLSIVAVMTAACSGSNPATKSEDGKKEAVTTLNIFSNFSIAQPPSPDNPVTKEFEKRTNTKLNITWVSDTVFNDKLNVLLASGDLPDMIRLPDTTVPQFLTMVKQGAFWDLTPYLKDYKNLMDSPKSMWDNSKVNGKNYVVPIVRPIEGGTTFFIRKDWLDKLGLNMPTTLDELYQVMKVFKEKEPDGKKGTYGYTMRTNDQIEFIYAGAGAKWKVKDGGLIDINLEPEMKASLLYKKKLYDEQLVPPDYSVMKNDDWVDLATSGRVGVTTETIEAMWRWTYDQWKRDPKVNWEPIVSLSAGAGPFQQQNSGFIGVFAIPKTVPEAKMRKILSLLDYGASTEGSTLSQYGIEGTHYKKEDGFFITNEQAVKDNLGTGSFGKLFMKHDPYMYAFAPGMPKEIFEKNKKIIDAKAKISVPRPEIGLVSETNNKLGADYNKKIADMKTQVVMGKSSIADWDKMVADLKQDANYQKIIQEMNAAYKERLASK